jgi:hypothetical protein
VVGTKDLLIDLLTVQDETISQLWQHFGITFTQIRSVRS